MKRLALFIFLLTGLQDSYAQNGIRRINTFYLGMESRFTKNIQCLDGGYAAIHRAGTNPTASLFRLNASFDVSWRVDLNAYNLNDVLELPDSSFLLCGDYYDATNRENIRIIKVSKTGTVLWTKDFGGSGQDLGNAIIKLNNGNLLITGTTSSTDGDILNKTTTDFDVLLLEISPAGSLVNQKVYGGSNSESGVSTIKLSGSQGFVVAATSSSSDGMVTGNHGNVDMWTFRVAGNYDFIWGTCVGGSVEDYVQSIAQTEDNAIVIVGDTRSVDGDFPRPDTYSAGAYVKMDLSGNVLWSRMIHSGLSIIYFSKVIATGNGSFVVTGHGTGMDGLPEVSYGSDHRGEEGLVYKIDDNGQVSWNRCIGGNGGDYATDVILNNAGNYTICGLRFIGSNLGDFINIPYLFGDSNSFILELGDLNGLKGYVYSDDNNNNMKDAGEAFFTEGFVVASKPGLVLRSDIADGRFLFGADSGTYTTSAYFKTFPPYDSSQFRILPKRVVTDFTASNQNDSINFRVVSINYLNDVEITGIFPDTILPGKNFSARIYFKNNLNKPVDSVKIKIPFGPGFSIHSANPLPAGTSGDTSFWTRYNFPALAVDSVSLVLTSDMLPYTWTTLEGTISPLENDFDTANNRLLKNIFIAGQNSAISNGSISISSQLNAGKGRPMPYDILYHFESGLDTTRAFVKVVKDPHSSYISSIPPASTLTADTITWNINTQSGTVTDTIRLLLKINEGPEVQVGDTITQLASLQFNTADTLVLRFTDSIRRVIDVICTDPDLNNTTLTAPQGLQWLRNFGGSDEEGAGDITIYDDSSFIVSGVTLSVDGDLPNFPYPGVNGFITKYNSNGMIRWKKMLGGNNDDYLSSAVKTSDNGLLIIGDTESNSGDFSSNHGDADVWLEKLDSAGNRLWLKLIGGSGTDRAKKIKRTTDGGYIFLGTTNSNNGDVTENPYPASLEPVWAVKINATGDILWQKYFGVSTLYDADDIIQSVDGGYMIAGYTPEGPVSIGDQFATVVKLDHNGNTVYMKKIVLPEYYTSFNAIVQNNDSSFLATGYIRKGSVTDSTCIGVHGDQDVLVTRLDKNGNVVSNKFYGGANDEISTRLIHTNDGGYLLAGSTNSFNGNVSGLHAQPGDTWPEQDGWIIKLDTAARLVWQKVIGGKNSENIMGISQLADNSIIFCGYTASENNGDIFDYKGGNSDAIVGKIGYTNIIRGYVFSDLNNDGIRQSNEPYFSNGFVTSTKGGLVSGSTITDGFFANSVDTGIYITKIISGNLYYSSNPSAGLSNFNTYLQADTVNFAMMPVPGINDLKISLIPLNIPRPGFAALYQLKYENVGTTLINNGSVRFIKPATGSFDSASVIPSSISADTLSWNYSNLSPQQSHTINIYLRLLPPPVNNIHDTINSLATVYPVAGDTTALNNYANVTQVLTGSFDPNIKVESHAGFLTNEQIIDGERLNYTIFFQNTGNDTAFRVIVRDTLNGALDWRSFEMISASHPYTLSVTDSNKIEWKFDPIILPDSNRNEVKSHGYVSFTIKPAQGTSAGNIIANKASIYFDYNTAIETNNNITFVSTENYICPGSNTYFVSGYAGNPAIQWQVNDGNGYTNLAANGIFSAVTRDTLTLTAPPSAYYGYKFRALINGNADSKEFTLKFGSRWKGTASKSWENPANWSCGAVPDNNTDVFINTGLTNYPEVNTNVGCRSILCKNGAYLLVKAGVQFTLYGK